jgi:hypothetical protein
MNLSMTALAAAAGATLTLLASLTGYGWVMHNQLETARDGVAQLTEALLLCGVDKEQLTRAAFDQTAAVARWRENTAAARKAAAAAAAAAATRQEQLEKDIAKAQATPAGTCDAEAEELIQWAQDLD